MITMKKDKGKTYMIIGIIILVLAIIGSTYAYYKYVFANVNVDTITRGLDYYITYAKGTDITNKVLEPSTDYTGGNSVTVTLYKKDNTYDIYGHIYLNVTSIGTTLSNSSALKYVVTDGTNILFNGRLKGVTNGSKIPLAVNIPLSTSSTKYTVYLWFDDNNTEETSSEGQTISASVSCEASMRKITEITYGNAAYKISKLYINGAKTNVINNGVTYQYDTTNNLMEDVDGNIRYYGANPNNYIYFNCDDYSNQTSSTCEIWRIIGVFEGKVKIMRGSQIGKLACDQDKNIDSSKTSYDNDWSTSSLQVLLNTSYLNRTANVTYYSGSSGTTTTTVQTSTIGIKDSTRNMISESMWYLRGWNSNSIYSDQIYEYERTKGSVYNSTRPTSWKGKIALAYPSDYGYAADFGQCTKNLYSYNDSTCTSNNWMFNGTYQWLLTPNSGSSSNAWYVGSGNVSNSNVAYNTHGVVPVLYLGSELDIGPGTGTSSSPYQLSV